MQITNIKKYNNSFIHFVFEDYKTTKLSNSEFANKYEINKDTLISWCKKYNVEFKRLYPQHQILTILEDYKTTELSNIEFRKKYKINKTTLINWCKKYNVEYKYEKYYYRGQKISKILEDYKTTELSNIEFEKKHKVRKKTLISWCKKYNVEYKYDNYNYKEEEISNILEDYKTTKLSNGEFRKKHKISRTTLISWCKKYNVEYKSERYYYRGQKISNILEDYKTTKLSNTKFAKKHKISSFILNYWCKKYNVEYKSQIYYYSKEEISNILEDYKTTKLSNIEFAKKHKLSPPTLRRWCKKYNVKYRDNRIKALE